MGAYAPAPLVSAALLSDIKNKVIQPTIDGLRKEGKPYVGVIYAGILLDKTTGKKFSRQKLKLISFEKFSIFEKIVDTLENTPTEIFCRNQCVRI